MIFREYVKPDRTKRPVPWVLSLSVHGGFLIWLLLWPAEAVRKSPSAYEQLFKGKEEKIVFYQFKEKLPDVKPLQKADSRPPRAEVKIAKQSIVASPKNAPKERQMVVMPAPEIKEPPKFQSPNVLALQMSPPAPPERKKFTPQAAQPKIQQELSRPKMIEAPQVEAVNPVPDKLLDQLGAVPKLSQDNRPKFVVPAARVNVTVAHVKELDAAPAEPAGGGLPTSGPSLSELNIAVVGLDPGPKNAPLPEGSHAAQFSAGPKLNPNGGAGEGNPNASLTVPDLMVKGGGADAKATMLAINRAAPTSAEALRGMSKYAAPSAASTPETGGLGSTGHSTAARVSNAPDPRFQGREVYSMAIQMPNITSYVGSWLMWYASRGVTHGGAMAAPVPYRKVDPKYVATAMADRIEGRVQLLCVINRSGRVDQVELIKGLDPRLDKSAMEALAKWEFTPATRSGVPVDVDVMVEIPFRLAPKEPK